LPDADRVPTVLFCVMPLSSYIRCLMIAPSSADEASCE
jgi:hypothetical protein